MNTKFLESVYQYNMQISTFLSVKSIVWWFSSDGLVPFYGIKTLGKFYYIMHYAYQSGKLWTFLDPSFQKRAKLTLHQSLWLLGPSGRNLGRVEQKKTPMFSFLDEDASVVVGMTYKTLKEHRFFFLVKEHRENVCISICNKNLSFELFNQDTYFLIIYVIILWWNWFRHFHVTWFPPNYCACYQQV